MMRRCFPLKDIGDDDVEYLVEGESLVIRQALNAQVKYDDLEQQKENIFHIRCHISNEKCSMITNGVSYANKFSTTLVRKLNLNLNTTKHHRPYRL